MLRVPSFCVGVSVKLYSQQVLVETVSGRFHREQLMTSTSTSHGEEYFSRGYKTILSSLIDTSGTMMQYVASARNEVA